MLLGDSSRFGRCAADYVRIEVSISTQYGITDLLQRQGLVRCHNQIPGVEENAHVFVGRTGQSVTAVDFDAICGVVSQYSHCPSPQAVDRPIETFICRDTSVNNGTGTSLFQSSLHGTRFGKSTQQSFLGLEYSP